ncbi:small peptidoglycan-associated lipoprotein [Pseudoneobacillus sp. C159]
MKGLATVSIFSLLFFIASCQKHNSVDSLVIKENVKQIIFVSDETNVQQEAAYYDAIIELKKDFPNEVENMMVLTKEEGKKYFDSLQVKKSPAMIVVYNNKVVASINGMASKDQILEPITKVLQ